MRSEDQRIRRKAAPWRALTGVVAGSLMVFGLPMLAAGPGQQTQTPPPAQNPPTPAPAAPQAAGPPAQFCHVTGTVTAGPNNPLPGVSIVVKQTDKVLAATSTTDDGKWSINFTPGKNYKVTADLMAFGVVEKDFATRVWPCDATLDFDLSLRPRTEPVEEPAAAAPASTTPPAGTNPTQTNPTNPTSPTTPPTGAPGAQAGAKPPTTGQRGAGAGQDFATLNVEANANGQAALDQSGGAGDLSASSILPAGFSLQNAAADSVGINGSGDAVRVDAGAMNDRQNAIGQGQFDPATGQFAAGFGPGGGGPGGGPGGPGGGGPGGQLGGGPGGGGGAISLADQVERLPRL